LPETTLGPVIDTYSPLRVAASGSSATIISPGTNNVELPCVEVRASSSRSVPPAEPASAPVRSLLILIPFAACWSRARAGLYLPKPILVIVVVGDVVVVSVVVVDVVVVDVVVGDVVIVVDVRSAAHRDWRDITIR